VPSALQSQNSRGEWSLAPTSLSPIAWTDYPPFCSHRASSTAPGFHGQAFQPGSGRLGYGVADGFDNIAIVDIVESATFSRWVEGLRDRRTVVRIQARLRNMAMGNFGDTRPVGDGVSEMRIH